MAKRNKGINLFRSVPKAQTNRTKFPMSHSVKFDGDFGVAYPIFCQEVLPGDTWYLAANHFSRLAPMIAPVYHDYDVRFHWFYCPMRLLWDDFEDWMTGGRTGTWREENPDAFPTCNLFQFAQGTFNSLQGTLVDFLGVSTFVDGQENGDVAIPVGTSYEIPVMPIRGYALIYQYFFRDQNVQADIEVNTSSGRDAEVSTYLDFGDFSDYMFRVAWDKDYFTSATLTPQRGPQVFVPIGTSAPVVATSSTHPISVDSVNGVVVNGELISVQAAPGRGDIQLKTAENGNQQVYLSGTLVPGSLEADLSQSTGAAVDDVREAFALQRFFERMQVVGSRFAEFLRGIWGTNAGDARLQMPEYLGTWQNPFMINNVSNTTGTAEQPQAGYAGNGMSSQYNKPIVKNFPENGYLYCLYVALPRNGYQQGLAPIFCRRDWLDFANPYFEHIGEQPIMTKELYFDPRISELNDTIFGYQSQYASYKFINSHSHGAFKQSLNFWHSNRIFDDRPTLSREFIHFNKEESTDRNFVLVDESKFYTVVDFDCSVERNLSAYSTPRLI